MIDKYISTSEAAERLGVSKVTIARWIQRDYLAAEKLGPGVNSPYRIPKSSVDQILNRLPPEQSHS
jgi:excisionase family DNA binding protein